MRVLIIEDEQKLARLLKKGLEEENHTVMLAHNGVEGFEMSREYPFDVIVLDVMLPGMTGFEVARQLRQSNNHVPILMLTARDAVADIVKGLNVGADDYLTKPFAFEVLLARLQAVSRRGPVERLPQLKIADLVLDLGRMGIGRDKVDPHELLELHSAGAIDDHLKDLADKMLEAREAEVGPEAWATIERFVLLRTIDSLWVEHLTEVDDMRRGIGLRGYAQQDPLNEFRKEAFRLYEELSGFIRHQVASTIFRGQVEPQPQAPSGVFPMAGPGQRARGAVPVGAGAGGAGATNGAGAGGTRGGVRTLAGPGVSGTAGTAGIAALGAGQQARPGYTPSGAKIGRNDACWCGSGLKYKKCHGR